MPETRPRYVNPPQDFSSPVTPPFVQQGDPYAGLSEILNNLSNPQQPRPESKLQQILNMIAQAAAVGTAQDPGQALAQQLQSRQALQQRQAELQQQAQQRADEIRLQIALERARGLAQDQQEFGREQRQRLYKKEDQQFQIEQFNRELAGKEKLDSIDFNQQKELFDIKQKYELESDAKRQEFQKELMSIKDLSDQRKQSLIQTVDLIQSGLDAGTARNIVRKFMQDEPLTKEESKALTASAQRARALALKAARSGSGSSYGISEKQAFQLLFEAAKTPHAVVIGPDGKDTVMEVTAIPKDVVGRPIGVKRYLTPEESAAYATQTTLPAVMRAVTGRGIVPQQQQAAPLPAQSGGTDRLQAIVQDAQRKGRTPDQIRTILSANGATPEQINSLLGVQREVQGPPTPSNYQSEQRLKGAKQQPVKKLPGLREMN